MQQTINAKFNETAPKSVATQVIGGKEYKVNSVYVGTQQLCTVLQRIAEKKALEEMGLK